MDAVVVQDVKKTFRGAQMVVALAGISLNIREGEIYGLLGPNGAGKTTLLSILVGLTSPDSGRVEVCGMPLPGRLLDIHKVVNLVRGFSGILEKYTARELLAYYSRLYAVPQQRVEVVLRRLGLWDMRDRLVGTFSTGWRQRFFLAKALINDPRVLFMDEPTVGLDLDASVAVYALIRELKMNGTTVLMTTHHLQEAEDLCDRIGVICRGRLAAEDTLEGLRGKFRGLELEEPSLREVLLAITRGATREMGG